MFRPTLPAAAEGMEPGEGTGGLAGHVVAWTATADPTGKDLVKVSRRVVAGGARALLVRLVVRSKLTQSTGFVDAEILGYARRPTHECEGHR